MSQVRWANAVNGNFVDGSKWDGGAQPGSGDDAILDPDGDANFSVTSAPVETVNSIQTAATATFTIEADFTALDGTGAGALAGVTQLVNGATVTLEGTVHNTGELIVVSTGEPTTILIGAGGLTLYGPFSINNANLADGTVVLDYLGDGADQQIIGVTPAAPLTIVDARVSGQGQLGGGELTLDNETDGFVEAKGGILEINTGASTIVNAGLIDAEGYPSYKGRAGETLIDSPIDNSGILASDGVGSSVIVNQGVTGSGRAVVSGGTVAFNASFDQGVTFASTSGTLVLAQSVDYTGVIIAFSKTGGEFLDLRDIDFVGRNQATLGGTKSVGVLAVTDGTHTARFNLDGDYTGSVFVTSSDGSGGTLVTDEPKVLHWLNPVSGSFQTNADWTSSVTPGAANDAVLDATGSRYTVTSGADRTVGSLQTNAGSTLAIAAGTFTVADGSGAGAIAGTITGAGTLALTGGAATFSGVPVLTAADVRVSGSGTAIAVATRLSFAGVWSQTAGTVSVGGGASLVFTGAGDSFAGTLTGAGTVALVGGSDTLAGTTLSVATFDINGAAVTLSGAISLAHQVAAASSHLTVAAGGVSFSGGGALALTNLASNRIIGAVAGATLTNVNDRILGAGDLGGGKMILVNDAAGIINADDEIALTIDTGTNTIVNAGLIGADAGGGLRIDSPISNSGLLVCVGSTLSVARQVSGSGSVMIDGGSAQFNSAFTQNVAFTGGSGELTLARSQGYHGTISGFSTTGGTSLDLQDVGFAAGTTVAIYRPNTGFLTVTDGAHFAEIHLAGDYAGSTFTTSSDGHGGTIVVDPPGGASARRFASAMASFAPAPVAGVQGPVGSWVDNRGVLAVGREAFS